MPATSYPRTANGATELSALPIPITPPVVVMQAQLPGLSSPGDGNGGLFYWNYTSTAIPDGFNTILSDNPIYSIQGRWLRYEPVIPSPGQVSTPTFSPLDSSFSTTVDVSILCATAGASIFYTTDGSDPTSSSTPYSVPITITVQTQFKAIAVKSGYGDSNIASKTYTPVTNVVATPVFSPSPGDFAAPFNLSITCATLGASIYYTLDGSPPSALSTLYTAPIPISVTTTVKAIGILLGETDSAIATGIYPFVPVSETIIRWGGNLNPTLTDFSKWDNDPPNEDFVYAPDTATPLTNFQADFLYTYVSLGQYPYFVMLNTSAPPATFPNGFKNGSLSLSTADFAGPSEGFNDVDANGWPCIIGVWPFDGKTYREYRLINQPFAEITLTVNQ